MKTQSMIYLTEEGISLSLNDEEKTKWQDIVEAMDLDGQRSLSKGESPIPFLWMNNKAKGIFKILCPMEVELSKYGKSPIPLDVLQNIKRAQDEKYFTKITIRYDDKDMDPVAIGTSDAGEQYLIARWGAERMSFEALEEKARKKCLADTKAQLQQKIAECKIKLESLDAIVETRINDGWFYV